MTWCLVYTAQAKKDAKKVTQDIKPKLLKLLDIISEDPFAALPKYEALKGVLKGAYSARITIQHRLFYQVDSAAKVVKVLRVGPIAHKALIF